MHIWNKSTLFKFLSNARRTCGSTGGYFIPGCVVRGLDLDLRVRPAPAEVPAAASGNLGIRKSCNFAPLGLRSKNKICERLGIFHIRSKVSWTWAEIEGFCSSFV